MNSRLRVCGFELNAVKRVRRFARKPELEVRPMLMPVFYFVFEHNGKWCVRADHHEIVESFRDKTGAIDAARTMARARWQEFGKTGGVKLQAATGWVDDLMFGDVGTTTT